MKYTKRIKNKRNRSSSSMMTRELSLAGSLVGASAITQGSELEDGRNQNQNQSQSFMIGGTPSSSSSSSSGCANELIRYFLELLNTIKIYHWSTLSYPTHKATDELHTKLSELVDSFIEIYIGHCSRIRGSGRGRGIPVFQFKNSRRGKGSSTSIPLITSLDAFCKFLDENIGNLNGITKKLDGYTDLVNIRDEMVGALAQTLYLLRLK